MTRPKITSERIGTAVTAVTNCIKSPLPTGVSTQLCRGQNVIMLDGMILPYELRTYRYWTPARYAVLWNDYVTWIEAGRGSKKEFCMQYAEMINDGLIPIFRLDAADSQKLEEGAMTWKAIQSQIDVFFAEENQALIKNSDRTVTCNPSALTALTYQEKIVSAHNHYEKSKVTSNTETKESSESAVHLEEVLETSSELTQNISGDYKPLDPAELEGILNEYGADSMEYKFALVTDKIHKLATATEGLAELVKSMAEGAKNS